MKGGAHFAHPAFNTNASSPNFWASCSQDPAAINHWPKGNYIVLSNYSTTYQMVDVCLAVIVRSERKRSRPSSEAMTIRIQQATPYTCLRTCALYVEWLWTL